MKLSNLLFAIISATVLVGALIASASARTLENSSLTDRASWTTFNFGGGFGIWECEVVLEGRFHARSSVKSVGSLLGYITAGNVTRCLRGGATINRASLPWHRQYANFSGRLPLITGLTETVMGAEFRLRDRFTGITCNVRAESSSMIFFYTVSAGTLIGADVSGFSRCGAIELEVSGGTTNVDNRAGARLTVTLI